MTQIAADEYYDNAIMKIVPRWIAVLLLAQVAFASAYAKSAATPAVTVAQIRPAVDQLQSWYDTKTGLWKTTGWWNSANALTVLMDFSQITHTSRYEPVAANTFAVHEHMGFINDYYDDEGWWALAWIDAYDQTGNQNYLHMAESIFKNMSGGWDSTCGGGLWWSKKRHYKNAIANELFLSVAAHLANRTKGSQRAMYLSWATREWHWFKGSGMIEHDHLISDGLTPACTDNHATKWTYNQGVILGGLTELSRATHHRVGLRAAHKIADAALTHLTDAQGILHDPCEPACGGDGSQFKGIFVRNLALLYQYSPKRRYRIFIERNARSILQKDQTPHHALGLVWSGPVVDANASTQSSALDALVAALQMNHKESRP